MKHENVKILAGRPEIKKPTNNYETASFIFLALGTPTTL